MEVQDELWLIQLFILCLHKVFLLLPEEFIPEGISHVIR